MNTPIESYIVLKNTDHNQLAAEVTKKLKEGWQLYGNPMAESEAMCNVMQHMQVMIKTAG
jgi:hypothetical protein